METEVKALNEEANQQLEYSIKRLEGKISMLKENLNNPNGRITIEVNEDCLAETRGWEAPSIDDFNEHKPIKETVHELFEALIDCKGDMFTHEGQYSTEMISEGESIEIEYPSEGGTIQHLEDGWWSTLFTIKTDQKDHELAIKWEITIPKSAYVKVTDILDKCNLSY